jgi:hypothetical protein
MNGAATAAAAVAKAVKASGAIERVEADEFRKLLGHNAQGPAREAILVPSTCQIVEAKKIWIPGE